MPKILGRKDITYNHQPQQPRGTREKNEKNDVAAVFPELPPKAFLLTVRRHPTSAL
ncbi:MAG: hypothetical protein HY295_06865 [Thaumarchaeota archaeon]|nr:hypothetical protein [Nitrososphaerota archaeon]